jgi:hypothetical protein
MRSKMGFFWGGGGAVFIMGFGELRALCFGVGFSKAGFERQKL